MQDQGKETGRAELELGSLGRSLTDYNTTALVKVNPALDAEIDSFYKESLKLKTYAEVRVIDKAADLVPATDDLSIIARVKKSLEDKRKEYTKPLRNHLDLINEAFKALMEPILEADSITREKILAFNAEQERIRLEQESINQKRIEAAQAEKRLKGESSEPVELVEVMPEVATTTRTGMGTAGMTDHWVYEVVNFAILPDEYKVADSVMLNNVAKGHHDKKQIAGVRFYNKPFISVRPK